MALREDQIVRYSRQILLRDVGGRGQERLLRFGVTVAGGGAASQTAAAYLGASGMPVRLAEQPMKGEVGYLAGAGEPSGWADALREANPDAVMPAPASAWLAEAPVRFAPDAPTAVVLSAAPQGARIEVGAVTGDRDRLSRAAAGEPVPQELSDQAGALAALVLQQVALGGPVPSQTIVLHADGRVSVGD